MMTDWDKLGFSRYLSARATQVPHSSVNDFEIKPSPGLDKTDYKPNPPCMRRTTFEGLIHRFGAAQEKIC